MITNLYMKNNKLTPKAQNGIQIIPTETQSELDRYNKWNSLSALDKQKRRMGIAQQFIQESPSIVNVGNAISALFGGYDPENPMLITGIAPTPGKFYSKDFLRKTLAVKDATRNYVNSHAEAQAAKDYIKAMGGTYKPAPKPAASPKPAKRVKTKQAQPTKPTPVKPVESAPVKPATPVKPEASTTKLVKKPNKKSSAFKYNEEKKEDAANHIYKKKRAEGKVEKYFGTGDGRHLNEGRPKAWERKELKDKVMANPSHPLHGRVNRLILRDVRATDTKAQKLAQKELKDLLDDYIYKYHHGMK